MLDPVVVSDIERMCVGFSMMGVSDWVNIRCRRSMKSATATAMRTTITPPIMPPTIAPIFFDFLVVLVLILPFVISGWPMFTDE